MRSIYALILALTGGCIYLLYFLISGGKVKDMETEVFKITLQFVFLAAFGQLVSLLVTRHSQKREESKAKDELRKDLVKRLNQQFVDCKKLRRLLRSKSERRSDDGLPLTVRQSQYDDALSTLNDIQLNLELLCKDIEGAQALFDSFDAAYTGASSMEEYLNRIVDEFENTSPQTERDPPVIYYTSLPRLFDLLGPYKPSKFRTNFVHAYYTTLDELKKNLIYIGKSESFKRPGKPPRRQLPQPPVEAASPPAPQGPHQP
jgi:hypothetical protein